jgi:CDGSH-type Zn-finger protein
VSSGCELNGIKATCFQASNETENNTHMLCYCGALKNKPWTADNDKIQIISYSYC